MDEGRCILIFAAPINWRTLRLKRIGETSSQRHNLRLPGAVNQRACLCSPSYQDSDSPDSSRYLARALASNESAKQSSYTAHVRQQLHPASSRLLRSRAVYPGGGGGEVHPPAAVSQTHWKPRPELDIDLNPDYPSPGNSEYGGRPVG